MAAPQGWNGSFRGQSVYHGTLLGFTIGNVTRAEVEAKADFPFEQVVTRPRRDRE